MVIKRRARGQEDKAARRQSILTAARTVFLARGFGDLTMAALARRAGLAKGTPYLYFKTKEEVFLALLQEELWDWLDFVETRLAALRPNAAPARVAALLSGTLAEREVLTRLLAILHTLVERNLDENVALAFKRDLLSRTRATGQALERVLGFLRPGQGIALLLAADALVIGFSQLADPAPAVRRLLERPDLVPFRVDFAAELSRTLEALMLGLAAQERRRRRR